MRQHQCHGHAADRASQRANAASHFGSNHADRPPTITIEGANPAIIHVGDSYADLGAMVSDSGPGQAGDANLGIKTFLNGTLVTNIVIDTTSAATDTIDYVATDSAGLWRGGVYGIVSDGRPPPTVAFRRAGRAI